MNLNFNTKTQSYRGKSRDQYLMKPIINDFEIFYLWGLPIAKFKSLLLILIKKYRRTNRKNYKLQSEENQI